MKFTNCLTYRFFVRFCWRIYLTFFYYLIYPRLIRFRPSRCIFFGVYAPAPANSPEIEKLTTTGPGVTGPWHEIQRNHSITRFHRLYSNDAFLFEYTRTRCDAMIKCVSLNLTAESWMHDFAFWRVKRNDFEFYRVYVCI